MPFQIAPFEETDIPEFAALDEEAVKGWPYAEAQRQSSPGKSRRQFAEEWTRDAWGKDDKAYWMKATDTETGEIASVALWILPLQNVKPNQEVPARNAAKENIKAENANASSAEELNFFPDMAKLWKLFSDEYIGTEQHAVLAILVSHPKYQRRGAGSMLVKWGCDQADERGIICALTASAAGEKVYTTNGFEIKKTWDVDLRPYGVDGTELRRAMIREPERKAALQ